MSLWFQFLHQFKLFLSPYYLLLSILISVHLIHQTQSKHSWCITVIPKVDFSHTEMMESTRHSWIIASQHIYHRAWNFEHRTPYIELRPKKTLLFALLSDMNANCSCSQWVSQGFLYIEHTSNSFRFQLIKFQWWRILTLER